MNQCSKIVEHSICAKLFRCYVLLNSRGCYWSWRSLTALSIFYFLFSVSVLPAQSYNSNRCQGMKAGIECELTRSSSVRILSCEYFYFYIGLVIGLTSTGYYCCNFLWLLCLAFSNRRSGIKYSCLSPSLSHYKQRGKSHQNIQ